MDPKKNAHPTRHAKNRTCPSTVVWQPSEKLLLESRERLLNDLYAIDTTLSRLRMCNTKSPFASTSHLLTPVPYPQTPVFSSSLYSRPPNAQTPPVRLNSPSSSNQKGRKEREGNTCFVEAVNSEPSPIDDTTKPSPEDSTHTSRRACRGAGSLRKNRDKRKATKVTHDSTKLNSPTAATHEGQMPTVHKNKVTLPQHVPAPVNNDANRGEKHISASLFPPAPSKLEGAVGNAIPSPLPLPASVNNDVNRGEKHISTSLFPPAPSKLEGAVGNATSLLSPVSLESGAKTPMLTIIFPTSEQMPILTITFESDSPELCTACAEDSEPPVAEQKDNVTNEGAVANAISSPGPLESGPVSDALPSSGSLERVPVNVSVSVLATEHNDSNGGVNKDRFIPSCSTSIASHRNVWDLRCVYTDAEENARFVLEQDPAWYLKLDCKGCNKKGKNTKCCFLDFMNKQGKYANSSLSEAAVNSITPIVSDIAMAVTQSLTFCKYHRCVKDATGMCNKHCESNLIYMAQSPAEGASLMTAGVVRPRSQKPASKERKCCCNMYSHTDIQRNQGKCCYEEFQDGEGKNALHHLQRNIAKVTREAAYPAYVAAKDAIEASLSSEEIANAVVGEYEKACADFTLKLNNAILEERTSREEVEHNQAVVALAAKQAAEAEYLAAYALRVDDSENSDESDYE